MAVIRRSYIYLVCEISLQAVTWAIIALIRNLLISWLKPQPTVIAFQIAVIVIGTPLYLFHWLLGQRSADKDPEERGATLRRLYLYGVMASFLGPFIANAYDFFGELLFIPGLLEELPFQQTRWDTTLYHLVALLVLGALWFYHYQVLAIDQRIESDHDSSATIRRFYILGFSATGLILATTGIIHLARLVMLQFGDQIIRGGALDVVLTDEIARLIVGVPLWLIFWRWANRQYTGADMAERGSALRKFYLYGAVFAGALSGVTYTAAILAGLFRRLLDLPPTGDIRLPLPVVIGMGMVWAYHAFILSEDSRKAWEAPRQASIRRLYLYLVAFTGLSALLVGLAGDINVILRSFDEGFGIELREQLAWFTAALLAGLPVWLFPWRQAQTQAEESGHAGTEARRSFPRKLYLYFFLFIATMTVLSSAVFIVYGVLSSILGADPPTFAEFAQAIGFSLIAIGVWLYHTTILRKDGRLSQREQAHRMQDLRLALVDVGEGQLGSAIASALNKILPELNLTPILVSPPGGETTQSESPELAAKLAQAGLIVGPWAIAVSSAVSPAVAQAVASSPARKLLIPTRSENWEWVGVDHWEVDSQVRQTYHAIRQILEGEQLRPHRPLSIGSIIAIIIGVLFLLILVAIPLLYFFY